MNFSYTVLRSECINGIISKITKISKITTIQLLKNIRSPVEKSKQELYAFINTILTETNFHVGRLIVAYEQQGSSWTAYAKESLINLPAKLTAASGKGSSVDNLENMRKFYVACKDDYVKYVGKKQKSGTLSRKLELALFKVPWSHYILLTNIDHLIEGKFYAIEAVAENRSLRELKRQYESALFEHLAISRNKVKVKERSKKGYRIKKPSDAIKDPYILEFLDLQEKDFYSENDIETSIIHTLEHFLLELGKGFLFVERQKRMRMDGDDYQIDLVFYHRILRSFVLIDLKIGTLKHQDLGQLQMYVNYYDEAIKTADENKTIGIILCKNKKESTIKYTLGKGNKQIFTSKYKVHFPEKQILN